MATTDCPFCSVGRLIRTASQAGEEVYCSGCLRVLKSASLKFSYDAFDIAGEVNECSDGGLPGYKGSGKKAKCHVYDPGDESGQEKAKQRARQSSYTTMKRSHIQELIREGAFGGFDTTKVPELATTNDQYHDNHFGPSDRAPSNAIGSEVSGDGVWDNNLFGDVNNNSEDAAY